MVNYKCRMCGGEINLGESGGFECPFCGTKSFMTDADFIGNETFRKKLVQYYQAVAKNKEFDYDKDTLYQCNGEENFIVSTGQELAIKYMYKFKYDSCTCYLAKENVVYVFINESAKNAFLAGINSLVFPEADEKLERCFPKLLMSLSLQNGMEALVFVRKPNFYPASLFAPWASQHLAWVISRMENICCELEYSGLEYGQFDSTAIWVNPITHEGALFGDWTKVRKHDGNKDLVDIRKTAIALAENSGTPVEMYHFLNTNPASDAYEDFSNWDTVIIKGFGGHHFVKM